MAKHKKKAKYADDPCPEWRAEVLAMIVARLSLYPCMHGQHDGRSTPPMNYDDWISCVVTRARKDAVREERARARGRKAAR